MAYKNVMLIEMSAENEDDSSKKYAADICLPASLYEIDDAVDKCRGYLIKTDMMPLSISECERVPLLSELRFDSVTIYELNFLAKQISEFDNTQLAAYNALLPLVVGENYEKELISIKDVINLTYCVDDYSVASNIFNDSDLGEMLIDNGMFEGIENLSDEMIEFLDAEKIGEAHRLEENGVYVNGCYISREGFELKEVFNGESLPDNAVDRYLFRLDISNLPIQNWITIPFSESTEQFLNSTNATEFNLVDFVSAIPQISKYSDGMHNKITVEELQRINELAKGFLFLDEIQSIKFKAALFYEGIDTLDDMDKIESILKNADSYNLKYFNVYPSDFAKDYLEHHLDEAFPKEYLELINTNALGDKLMEELQGGYTPYGILLKSSNEQILGNESKHESRTMENNMDTIANSKTYADYIATRPRTQKFGTHGLFTDDGVEINLKKVSEELNNHGGNVWTMIVSLHREDAERLGFNRGERWRDMLRTQVEQLSTNLKIPMKNLRWYAAFHNESHHPHIHLIAYSAVKNEGYLSRQGIERMRSSLASDIFQQDLISIYEKQTEHRREIKESSKDIMNEIVSEINSGTYDNLLLEEKLLLLADKLSRTSGKKVYGYLKADVKSLIDSIADLIAEDERVSKLYDLWYENKFSIIRTYTDELPDKIPLSKNKEFKSVKNMIISQAMDIALEKDISDNDDDLIETEAEQSDDETNDNKYDFTDKTVEDLYHQAQKNNSYAQYTLGKMYLKGEGVKQNAEYGVRWLLKAIKQNNSYAQYLLGKAILKGEYLSMDDNLPLDVCGAVELLLKSSDQGNEYASYTLGKIFIEGQLLPQDISAGFELLLKATEKNYVPAWYFLGKMFYKGLGVAKDIDASIYYFEKAVKEKNRFAAYQLGKIYSSEEGYIDMSKAIDYFMIAAQDQNSFAEYQLGKIFLYGNGVEKDYDIAMHYLHLSAEHGNQYAEQLLYSIQKQKNIMAAMNSLRLLQHISNLIRRKNQEQSRRKIGQIDRKIQQKINEKKQAHGLKPSM